jgi:hypothetical protein
VTSAMLVVLYYGLVPLTAAAVAYWVIKKSYSEGGKR